MIDISLEKVINAAPGYRLTERDGTHELDWDEREADAKTVAEVLLEQLRILKTIIDGGDSQGLTEVRVLQLGDILTDEQIAALLKTRMFGDTRSTEIKVTTGHSGLTPWDHILEVIRYVQLPENVDFATAALQLSLAILHDPGKGIAAQIADLEAFMEKLGRTNKHYHPDHANASVLLVAGLMRADAFQAVKSLFESELGLDAGWFERLERMIQWHHCLEGADFYEKEQKLMMRSGVDFDNDFSYLKEISAYDLFNHFLFLYIDMCSTKGYRQYWSTKVKFMKAFLAEYHPDLKEQNPDLWRHFQEVLEFDPNRIHEEQEQAP